VITGNNIYVLKIGVFIFSWLIYKWSVSSSFQLHKIIARYVTHISDELEPIKVVCYGQIGTYERVHVLLVTKYVKYITYFKESILPNWSHTFRYNSIISK